ncbi:glycosyltransferase family 4 protein [Paenibacillus ferrarius]|uniref:glycosyltransferase family 4 protein n=1 Tax=Paenibacillus ferrarius TaxID=1469647 RepID=UPI003D279C5F
MRILYIQPYASQVGGVDTVLLQLVQGLDSSIHQAYVLLPSWSPYVEKYREAGAEVLFGTIAVFGKPTDRGYYFRNMKKLISSMREMKKLVKQYGIDLIHSHKMEVIGGNIVGKLLGIPTVQTVHELPRRPLAAYQFVGLLNHLFNDKVIVLCERSKIMFKWGPWRSGKLTKIYNGIRLPDRSPVPAAADVRNLREELALPSDSKIMITVARLNPMKGIEYVIEAARQLKQERKDVAFVIVGDVAFDAEKGYKDELLALARQAGVDHMVHFLGLRRDVPALLAQSDVFVLPSVYDIFPTVILEAMSAGLPVVATDVGGVPEMVTAEVGLLVPAQQASALKAGIAAMLQCDGKAIGERGRARVAAYFSQTTYVSHTVALYESLMNAKRPLSAANKKEVTSQ